jgi:replicative DNA helicase
LLRTGSMTEDQWGRVVDATAYLDPLPIAVSDVTRLTPSKLRSICRRRKMSGGVGLVIVDYLQLMTPEVARENRVQEVSALSREAKLLAREMHVPVLMLCQLSRAVEGRGDKRPQLSDLRESGSLEQDADVVAFLYREGYYDRTAPGKETEVIVAKNRNGPPGTVQVMFTPETNRFAAIAKA